MTPLLEIEGLQKRFGGVTALAGISLSLPVGATLALLGPNGAGKSTLFSCLLGFARPTAGTIHFHGKQPTPEQRRNFGYVSERVSLYPNRTVLENASFFAELKHCPSAEASRQLHRLRLGNALDKKVRQLSKGMLQRLGLAIALLGEPGLLLLDEPFNGLDPLLLDEFVAIIRQEQSRGATFIISTHTISALEPIASHVAILLRGRLAFHGSMEELRLPNGARTLEQFYHDIAREKLLEPAV